MICNFVPFTVIGLLGRIFGSKKATVVSRSPATPNNPRSQVTVMLNAYLAEPVQKNVSPLLFWKDYTQLPELRDLAVRLLGVIGTSTASERDFSAAGYTANNRRSNLSTENLQEILFINRNSRLLQTL